MAKTNPYERIAADLRAKIVDGTYPPGARLPSLAEIQEWWKVSRATANRAVRILREEGLVICFAGSGRGCFVRVPLDLLVARSGWDDLVNVARAAGHESERRPIAVTQPHYPSSDVREALELDSDDLVICRYWETMVDGKIVQQSSGWYPFKIVWETVIVRREPIPGGPAGVLSELGFSLDSYSETLRARMPTERERDQMGMPPGLPVLEASRVVRGSKGVWEGPLFLIRSVSLGEAAAVRFEGRYEVRWEDGEWVPREA